MVYNNLFWFCGFIPLPSPTQFVFAYSCSFTLFGSQVPLESGTTFCSWICSYVNICDPVVTTKKIKLKVIFITGKF